MVDRFVVTHNASRMFTELSTQMRRHLTHYDHEAHSYSLSGGFARGLEDPEAAADAGRAASDAQQADASELPLRQRTLLVTDAASD